MAVTAQRHRIRREVLEVQTPDEDSARRVQGELTRIQRQRLESIIERCCSDSSPTDRIHRIDLLEVDLGILNLERLERELPDKLNSELRKALARQIGKQESESSRRDHDPAATSQLELVAYFAATGTLPWWADFSNPRLIPEALDALLEHAPDRLADLLRSIVREPGQLIRIVLHCNDRTLSGLARVLVSASPSFTAVLQQQIEAILSTRSSLPGSNITRIRNSFWLALIGQATTGMTSSASFWQKVFGEIETQSHDAYMSLAAGMLRAVRSSHEDVSTHLTLVLQAVFADRRSRLFTTLPPDVQVLGQLPGDEIRQAATGATSSASFWQQTFGEIEQAESGQLLDHENRMQTGKDGVDSLAESISQRLSGTDFATTMPRRFGQDAPLDLEFGDADTVYIENSGLVILWPFLPRFFERLELIEDDSFKDLAAQHRATGLLQYLVTEDPSPPEYQTTLAKVLCGLDPGVGLEFDQPVTEAESEECATFLSSVIAQAPILHEMSIDGFRGSFLLRKGLLTARDGVWLLRVERETYDVVLDRFPWSVNWVKLPWMEVPLGVEW
jgi:hypothetical protein